MDYTYSYLIGDAIILVLWLILFFLRKDTRREMLIMSLIFGIVSIIMEGVYIKDWWKPLTITGTIPGVEDFLFGFGAGGFAAVIYEHLFNIRIKIKKVKKRKEEKRNLNLVSIMILFLGLFFGSFFILGFNSFIATIISLSIPTTIIYAKRPNLIKDSLISGLLVLGFSIVGYYILNFITPGFFQEFWLFGNIGKRMILGIPLEEYIFYFLFGIFAGPLYEYWQEGKLIKNIKIRK